MNADIERLKMLLTETIALLCQRGLTYQRELRVQGLLGITVDGNVFLIPVDERTFIDNKQPSCVNRETEVSAACDSNSVPQHHDSAVRHVEKSEVHHAKDDVVNIQPLSTQYPVVNNNPGLLTVPKTEIVDRDIDGNADNKIQMPNNRSSEYFSASEPLSQTPFQSPHSFPTATFSFGSSATTAPMHTPCEEIGYEGKRKRKRSTFGDDMLVLSPDNDEWTNNSQREVSEPVAGCSHWADFGDELQHDIAVSMS